MWDNFKHGNNDIKMVYINEKPFYEEPERCWQCPFFFDGGTPLQPNRGKGHCLLFDEMHDPHINVPRRCGKLFRKAFQMPEGSKLSVVYSERNV